MTGPMMKNDESRVGDVKPQHDLARSPTVPPWHPANSERNPRALIDAGGAVPGGAAGPAPTDAALLDALEALVRTKPALGGVHLRARRDGLTVEFGYEWSVGQTLREAIGNATAPRGTEGPADA
jgi:hypothetical protein